MEVVYIVTNQPCQPPAALAYAKVEGLVWLELCLLLPSIVNVCLRTQLVRKFIALFE
jgi:hypothetical protein